MAPADERYQQLVELAPDAILIHDGERIVMANGAALRLAGATQRAQLVGLPVDRFLNPPYLKAVETQLLHAGATAELSAPVRDTFRRVDGVEIEVEVRVVGFMDHDRPSAHLVIRDITERLAIEQAARDVQERLHQAQRMESVGALAGGVAHEINNMMQVILGSSDFLIRDTRLPEECLTGVREIIAAADRAAVVTQQLLAFSRRAVHRPQVVNLGAAVREAEAVVRRLLGDDRQLVVVTHAAPHVSVDPGQLQQVIINLVLNARDAMPKGGTLTLTTAETQLPGDTTSADGVAIPAGRYAVLVVQDTGIGMDAAVLAKIFEPFFTTKPLGQGTGLGLAAAQGVLKQNDGYISVASAPGQGTTFTVLLPLLPAAAVVTPRAAPPPVSTDTTHAGGIVLVVDDEPGIRRVAARILERSGFHVLQAADGAEALTLIAERGSPHAVLTDMMMPVMGGAELARRLQERWPELPVVFMSGYSVEELHRQGALPSEQDFLQKPFTPEALVARVVAVLKA